jgi:hypothetical protein
LTCGASHKYIESLRHEGGLKLLFIYHHRTMHGEEISKENLPFLAVSFEFATSHHIPTSTEHM